MNRIFFSVFLLGLFPSPFTSHPSPAFADVIYLKAGEDLKGLVVEEHRDRIVINVQGKERMLLRSEVEEIFFDEPERNFLYLGFQALETGEFGLAREFFHKSLQIHPQFREAEEAVGRLRDLQAKPSAQQDPDPEATLQARWGVALEPTDRFPRVREVKESSFGARMGLVPGDRLVGAWGASLAYLPLKEAALVLLGPAGSELKLALERQIHLPAATSGKGGFIFSAALGRKWPDLSLEMEPSGLTVVSVRPGGAAETAGIRIGDRITAVGGRPTRYAPLMDSRRWIEEAKGRGLTLVIHRDLLFKRE